LPPFNKCIPAGAEFDNVGYTPENVLTVYEKAKKQQIQRAFVFPSDLFKKLASHFDTPFIHTVQQLHMSVGKLPADEWRNAIIT